MTEMQMIGRVAERVHDGVQRNRQNQNQRRNQVVDLYGVEYTRQGDKNSPATFYISVSPDMVYYERFEFKIIIQPFAMPVSGGGRTSSVVVEVDNANVQVGNTALSTSGDMISPNPHSHSVQAHNHATVAHEHSLISGITLFPSTVNDFEVWIEEIDITPYLKAQFPGEWIDGEGIFPKDYLAKYDILKAVGFMPSWQQGIILTPGFKKVEFRANGVFHASLINYLKLSHVNR